MKNNPNVQLQIEQDLILNAIYQHYGYDFREYTKESILRRLQSQADKAKVTYLSELIPMILYDESYASSFLMELSVCVTEMFRDPEFYMQFKKIIIPSLKTYPYFKIWHAGCATGEEAYSMAILLKEDALLDRANIYATDYNLKLLSIAREGIYKNNSLEQQNKNYLAMGGKKSLRHYYSPSETFGKMKAELQSNILFTEHNLTCDNVFSETDVILCRNVLIYFNKALQEKVIDLFYESLSHKGYLCLGVNEHPQFICDSNQFKLIDYKTSIYQKI